LQAFGSLSAITVTVTGVSFIEGLISGQSKSSRAPVRRHPKGDLYGAQRQTDHKKSVPWVRDRPSGSGAESSWHESRRETRKRFRELSPSNRAAREKSPRAAGPGAETLPESSGHESIHDPFDRVRLVPTVKSEIQETSRQNLQESAVIEVSDEVHVMHEEQATHVGREGMELDPCGYAMEDSGALAWEVDEKVCRHRGYVYFIYV
jgi:hypothetical protein